MTTLNDLIQINSTNTDAAIVVNRGLNNHNLVDSFAPTKSAVAVLKHLREAVLPTATQEQRALNIFGSYGSGKSHLAVVMAHLLRDGSGDIAFEHFFERLRNFGESTLAENLKNTFLNSNDVDAKPYLLVSLYGSKAPSLGSMLMEGLYDALERHPKLNPADILPATEYDVCVKRFETMIDADPALANAELSKWEIGNYFTTDEMVDDLKNHQPIALETFKDWYKAVCFGATFNPAAEGGSNFIDAYFEAGKNLSEKHGYGGIVVLWDELGLALENLISNPLRDTVGEIFDLQAFVEKACAPARGHTLFLGLTHISFQEYASRMQDKSVKNRLEAIFGRFRAFKIELSAAESEGYHLLGMQRMWTDYGLQQLEHSRVNQLKIAAICSALPLFKTLEQNALNTLSAEIYPLHPVMAAGLFALSKLAQANRTALTFFRENSEKLLSRPIDENALFDGELVRLPELVDYYEPTIKDKKSHELERYQRAVGKINADATEQEIQGRKSILKLLLLNALLSEEGENFQTNETFLACALYDAEPNTSASEKLHLDLAWLKGAELIWKNDLTQQWTLLGDSGGRDKKTIDVYNNEAEKIAKLHASLTPHRIYELIDQYFIKGKSTADIGCGIGRDTNFLNNHGFSVVGIDASEGMLEQARQLYPDLNFQLDYLPTLANFENSEFQNILCSAVLMHLNEDAIETACLRLVALLKKDGRLIISIRGTNQENKRENGKLYEAINVGLFKELFKQNDCEILLYENEIEQNRGLTWHNFVIKK